MMELSTLCYLEKDGKYLMLHRVSKKNDINRDKWIGVGGHFLEDESPEECVRREVLEETGYTLQSWRYRGLVTFVSGSGITEYMSLFTSDDFTGTEIDCDEGKLEWVDKKEVWNLNLWPGDKIFFRLLEEGEPFFSLKLVYDGKGNLTDARLNGAQMELFDLLDDEGKPNGLIQERGVVHREGLLHETVHMWIVRPNERGFYDVLLQKRSQNKDSYPGCYDISSAGHMAAGDEPAAAALREMKEELGIEAEEKDLQFVTRFYLTFEGNFHGYLFRDREYANLYVYERDLDIRGLTLQPEELEGAIWMDLNECCEKARENSFNHCLRLEELGLVMRYLKEKSHD